jgi:hypothetical protein
VARFVSMGIKYIHLKIRFPVAEGAMSGEAGLVDLQNYG